MIPFTCSFSYSPHSSLWVHPSLIIVSYMAQGNKTKNEANWFMDLRSGLCYFHQALLGGNMLPGKPRASSRRRPPLLLTELGRAWASLRSERGQGLAAGPGESCFTLTEVFQTQMQGWILLEKFFVNPRGKIRGKPACCSISAYSRSAVIRKCIKCKCIKCYCIKIALPGTRIFHILDSLNNTKLKVPVQRAKLLFFQIHD